MNAYKHEYAFSKYQHSKEMPSGEAREESYFFKIILPCHLIFRLRIVRKL